MYQALDVENIEKTKQLIVVTTENWTNITGSMSYFQKDNHKWKVVKSKIPIVVGKNGLGWADSFYQKIACGPLKKEGDDKAPAGILKLGKIFGFENSSNIENYINVETGIECIDDSNSKYYNQIININDVKKDWKSSEKMSKVLNYKYGIQILYNVNPTKPKKGSCIFMHIWAACNKGTEGCTAMSESDIKQLQEWLDHRKESILIQLPKDIYSKVRDLWHLPVLFEEE